MTELVEVLKNDRLSIPAPRSSFVQRVLRWRFLIIVNLLIILFLGSSLGRQIVRDKTIQAQIDALQLEAQELTEQNLAISELSVAMQTESFIEREARLKLGMKKPGETVIVMTDKEVAPADTNEADGTHDPTDPLQLIVENQVTKQTIANPTKWWYYFFNKNAFEQL